MKTYYEFTSKNKRAYSKAIEDLEEKLAPYAARSEDAVLICSADNSERKIDLNKMKLTQFCFRSPYQIDSDKIIYSKYNLVLNGKTQVFIAPSENQFITRASHTEIVTNLAESIARGLGLNEDLTKAIAKGHDIGHTAFGHMGEKELDRICKEHYCCLDILQLKKFRPETYKKLKKEDILDSLKHRKDEERLLLNLPVVDIIKEKKCIYELKRDFLLQEKDTNIFSHSKQSFRFLSLFEGKNLTAQTVYGIIAHSYNKDIIYPEISFEFEEEIKRPDELRLLHSKRKPIVSDEMYELNSRFITLEGQVVKFSDFLSFTIHDLDDAIRAKLITQEQLKKEFKKKFSHLHFEEYLKGTNRYSKYIIDFLDFNKTRNLKKKKDAGPIKDENLLITPPKTYDILNWLSELISEKVHAHEKVEIRNQEAKKYVRGIFEYYWDNRKKKNFDNRIKEIFPELKTEFRIGGYSDIRKFCDFISGLTDTNIINIYRGIYGPEQDKSEFSLII